MTGDTGGNGETGAGVGQALTYILGSLLGLEVIMVTVTRTQPDRSGQDRTGPFGGFLSASTRLHCTARLSVDDATVWIMHKLAARTRCTQSLHPSSETSVVDKVSLSALRNPKSAGRRVCPSTPTPLTR